MSTAIAPRSPLTRVGVARPSVAVLPTSPERAVRAQDLAAEGEWLGRNLQPGWHLAAQQVVESGGRLLDVLRVRHANGVERDYYFDVTPIVARVMEQARQRPAGHLGEAPAALSVKVDAGAEASVEEGSFCDPSLPACRNPGGQKSCTLPSGDSACDLMSGNIDALPRVIFHTVGRSALIGIGIYLAGERDWTKIAKYGLGAALAIEVFALGWTASQQAE